MTKAKAQDVVSPWDQLPIKVQRELINYLIEGNNKEDLAVMVYETMSLEEMVTFLRDIRSLLKIDTKTEMPETLSFSEGL